MLSTDAATAFDNIGTDVEDNPSAQTPYSLADAADCTNDGSTKRASGLNCQKSRTGSVVKRARKIV